MSLMQIYIHMTESSEQWVEIPDTGYSISWASNSEGDNWFDGRLIFVSKEDDIRTVIDDITKIYYSGIAQAVNQGELDFAEDLLEAAVCDEPFISSDELDRHTPLIRNILTNMPYNIEWKLSYHSARRIITVYSNAVSEEDELQKTVHTPVTTAAAVRMALSTKQHFSEGFSAVQVHKYSGVPASSFEQRTLDIVNAVNYSPEQFDYIVSPLKIPIDD